MNKDKQNIVIRIDSQAAILALKANIVNSALVFECLKSLNALGDKNKIQLQWIKSHVGHLGNEEADMLAKKGAELVLAGPEPFLPVSSAVFKKKTHNNSSFFRFVGIFFFSLCLIINIFENVACDTCTESNLENP